MAVFFASYMPFEIITADEVLCITFQGLFDTDCLHEAVTQVERIEAEAAVSPDRLIDLTAVESMELTFADMKRFADIRRVAPLKNKVKSAIVAPQPVHRGFARMFQTILENPKITVNIFPDRNSACAWLKEGKSSR